jgi:citrate lyase synthetase
LPQAGIEVCEIARAEQNGVPISASTARALIQRRDVAALSGLLPATTLEFLREKEMI